MRKSTRSRRELTIGVDLGDQYSQVCVFEGEQIVLEERIATTVAAMRRWFSKIGKSRVAMEAGTHSPWVSRLLEGLGHEVLVANPRKLRLIYENRSKDDRVDARYLGRLGRLDPELLASIKHRSKTAQEDLAVVRTRDQLVGIRTQLINHVRGVVKTTGNVLRSCSSRCFSAKVDGHLPEPLRPALVPVLSILEALNTQIRVLDRAVAKLSKEKYPDTALLRQVDGVGPIIALTYRLTLEDPARFADSRTVGAYLGLAPGRSQSGRSDPQRGITKEGDSLLRRLLVQAAQYMLGRFGPDCDLRRFGAALAARGGKNARKRAVIAVARKLAVLLHSLWRTGQVYEPLRAAA